VREWGFNKKTKNINFNSSFIESNELKASFLIECLVLLISFARFLFSDLMIFL